MNESSKAHFKCNHCDYKSDFKHNVYRHIRGKHPEVFDKGEVADFASSAPSSPVGVSLPRTPPPPPPSPREEEEGDLNIDQLLDEKLSKFLEDNKVAISPAVRQSAMKKMMSSQGATLLAGMIIGYILTNNLPMILGMIARAAKNGSAPPRQVGAQQMSQEQIQAEILMRQHQAMNQRARQSNESVNQSNQSVPPHMVSAPGSSSIPSDTSPSL